MFRFTIRDLLWLTVVVALGVAWWVDRGRLIESNRFYFNAFWDGPASTRVPLAAPLPNRLATARKTPKD